MDWILIYNSPTGYRGYHVGPQAAMIRELFGTDILPTAFTPRAEVQVVVAELTALNPEHHVRFIGELWRRDSGRWYAAYWSRDISALLGPYATEEEAEEALTSTGLLHLESELAS